MAFREYLLLCNHSSYPFAWRTRFRRIPEGIHDAVGLVQSLLLGGDVGFLIKDEEEIHEIASDAATL